MSVAVKRAPRGRGAGAGARRRRRCWRRPASRSAPRRRCSARRPACWRSSPAARRERSAHPRTLTTVRFLRAYPGAPPRIPHGLTPEEFRTDACRTCHERGGFSLRFAAYVPVTPHPERGICLQCHVGEDALMGVALPSADPNARCPQCHGPSGGRPRADATLTWATTVWPPLPPTTPDSSPPPIPHDLQFRENCLTCHSGPAAVAEIRTTHPERANCRQCHVALDPEAGVFTRPAGRRGRDRRRAMSRAPAGCRGRVRRSGVAGLRLRANAASVRWDQPPPGTVVATVDSATAARNATLEPGALATVQAVPVERWNGPGDRPFEVAAPKRRAGGRTRPQVRHHHAADRAAQPRGGPQSVPLHVVSPGPEGGHGQQAHRRRAPEHPAGAPGRRPAPSAPPAIRADDVELLALKSGERATLDESYRLCAQCHFAQAEAWAGGAHGKRLDGWQGRRVVMACADCHDPHKPAVQPRIPFRAPQIERTRSHGP